MLRDLIAMPKGLLSDKTWIYDGVGDGREDDDLGLSFPSSSSWSSCPSTPFFECQHKPLPSLELSFLPVGKRGGGGEGGGGGGGGGG